jgi:hypothetical protein
MMDQAELMLLVEQQEGGQQQLLSMQEALHMMVGGLDRVLLSSRVTNSGHTGNWRRCNARMLYELLLTCDSAERSMAITLCVMCCNTTHCCRGGNSTSRTWPRCV